MRKCKLIYSERKKKTKMSGCLETKCGDSEEGDSTEAQENFWGDGYVHCIDCSVAFTAVYIYENFQNCTL